MTKNVSLLRMGGRLDMDPLSVAEAVKDTAKPKAAQNMNDQAETILMRIIGYGHRWFGSIEYIRNLKRT